MEPFSYQSTNCISQLYPSEIEENSTESSSMLKDPMVKKRNGYSSNSEKSEDFGSGSGKRLKKFNGGMKNEIDEIISKKFIHVRAKRGQATDTHSLAERVRREKISERMKILQLLVPGCNKVTSKTLMLEEIINYVQSLQSQVEFLSSKLASSNPLFYEFGSNMNIPIVRPPLLSMPECSTTTSTAAIAASAACNNSEKESLLYNEIDKFVSTSWFNNFSYFY